MFAPERSEWNGKRDEAKHVEANAVEVDGWRVITVIVKVFRGSGA